MPDLYQDLVRRLTDLEQKNKALELQRPRYDVVNTQLITLGTDQTAWDIPDVDYILLNPTGNINIHGIANPVDGRKLYVANIGSAAITVTLKHESGSASAANRINTPTAADITFSPAHCALLIYSIQNSGLYRWRVLVYS